MKKHIYTLIALLCGWGLFSACNEDFLDIPQQGVQDSETVYKNADDETVNSLISAIYTQVYAPKSMYSLYSGCGYAQYLIWSGMETLGGDSIGGNAHNGANSGWDGLTELTADSENAMFSTLWSYYYTIMYWCNLIVDYLPDNTTATADVRDRVVAEARTIRSIMMMYLVQLYGNPPLADHVLLGTEGNTPASESWAFINSELAEAAEGLPSKTALGTQSSIGGRLTKEAAYAYLGKAYLWQGDWDNAAKYLGKVISSGLYALYDDYYKLSGMEADFCDEYLWEFYIEDTDATFSEGLMMLCSFMSWCDGNWSVPYQYTDGGFGYGVSPSASFGEFMEEHDMVGGVESNRFKGTLVTYEDLFDATRWYYLSGVAGLITPPVTNNQGYLKVKHVPQRASLLPGNYGLWYLYYQGNNLCYMRYSEVLLNYAEAVAMGGSATAISGLEALNMVRRRAGLSEAPSLDMDNATYGVKAERRAELFDENARYIDLVRWGDAATVLKDKGKYWYSFSGYKDGNNTTLQSKDQWQITATASGGSGWNDKFNLLPIPYSEMQNNTALEQNPGW